MRVADYWAVDVASNGADSMRTVLVLVAVKALLSVAT
jgi:hypothetical protein